MKFSSTKDLISGAWSDLNAQGELYEASSSEQSVFQGSFKEILGWSATLNNPSARMIHSPNFNEGLAVARFLYLIRGTNTVEEIAFYAPRVMDFSDDGIHLFGSSYGFKIFKDDRFWNMVEKLQTTKNSKRLYFPIFTEDDFLRDSKDIPCAIGFLLEPRGNVLNVTLLMRANDAQKLLPYNLFEFSLLHECIAVASGMTIGEFSYYAGSLHLRGDDTTITENPWDDASTTTMKPVTSFTKEIYELILEKEEQLRKGIPLTKKEQYVEFVVDLVSDLDEFWRGIFYSLAEYGYKSYYKEELLLSLPHNHE